MRNSKVSRPGQTPAYFGLILFRHLKKKAGFRSQNKTCSRSNEFSRLTRNIVRTDRTDIKRIMVFGDSNSFRPERGKTSWPKLLGDKDPLYLNIFNKSCDGRTTRYDLGERNSINVIGNELTSYSPLDFVIVMLGTNDVKNKYGPPSPAEIAEGMRQLVEIIENHGGGAEPILLTPPPLGHVTLGELAGAQFRIPPVADEYRQLAMNRDIRLIDIHSILEICTDLESDMIHLNAIGRRKIANAVWENMKGKILHNDQTEESHK